MTEFLPLLIFLYGTIAGFLLVRLRRNNEVRAREERMLVGAGHVIVALSLTLAGGLLLWAIARELFASA